MSNINNRLITYYIYEIVNNINQKNYIGKHTCLLGKTPEKDNYMGSGVLIIKAEKKYGIKNFSKNILAICYSENELNILETAYISLYRSIGKAEYNITDGGEGVTGLRHSEETKRIIREKRKLQIITEDAKRKISENNIGKHDHDAQWRSNISHRLKGREIDVEHREKISKTLKSFYQTESGKELIEQTKIKNREAMNNYWSSEEGQRQKEIVSSQHKGIPHSKEHIEKIRLANIGQKRSEETLAVMSEAAKQLWQDDEYREKQVLSHTGKESPMKGKTFSQEVRNNMSEAHKGNKQSEETKRKISEFNKGKVISEEQRKQISQALSGTHYYNNGEVEIRSRECPPGFVPGRLKISKSALF